MAKKPIIDPQASLQEGVASAEKAVVENADILSNRVFALAAGGLGLSFTVISYIVGENKSLIDCQAIWIWISYIVWMLLDTISVVFAKARAMKLSSYYSKLITEGGSMVASEVNSIIDERNRLVRILNNVCLWGVLASIIWTIIYSYCLLIHI